MSKPVPFIDLQSNLKQDRDKIERAWKKVLRGGRWILGPEVAGLEADLSRRMDGARVVGVNSGTDALVLALRAFNIGEGDEVLLPAFSFQATAGAVALTGAKPVFCDIDPVSFNLDPRDAARRVTKRSRAILPVHLYGRAAEMDSILALAKKNKLKVIEDACQAVGATYLGRPVGALADAAAVSFYPTKNLGGFGDGGVVICKNAVTEKKVRALRNHGQERTYDSTLVGFNSRLDELQAAALRIRLKRLDAFNKDRRALASAYDEGLDLTPLSLPPLSEGCAWHQYTVRVPSGKRNALAAWLRKKGIACGVYYPKPLHKQTAFKGRRKLKLPVVEKAAREVLSLPMFPGLGAARQKRVVEAVRAFYKRGR